MLMVLTGADVKMAFHGMLLYCRKHVTLIFKINFKLADLLVYRTVFSCSKVPDEGARRAKFADGFPASRK